MEARSYSLPAIHPVVLIPLQLLAGVALPMLLQVPVVYVLGSLGSVELLILAALLMNVAAGLYVMTYGWHENAKIAALFVYAPAMAYVLLIETMGIAIAMGGGDSL